MRLTDVVTDQQVSQSPNIQRNYEKNVVLHNECVTQSEFDAIMHRRNFLYLCPNSLFARVSYNIAGNAITLQEAMALSGNKQHFCVAAFDEHAKRYNTCADWKLQKAPNGSILNCYPEHDILHDHRLWQEIMS